LWFCFWGCHYLVRLGARSDEGLNDGQATNKEMDRC
jgi:hypothetical protein